MSSGGIIAGPPLADREVGRISRNDSVVCILTGSGFKDRDAMTRLADRRPQDLPIPLAALRNVLAKAHA